MLVGKIMIAVGADNQNAAAWVTSKNHRVPARHRILFMWCHKTC